MHLLSGILITAIGLFMLVCGTVKSEFIIYRLLVARSRLQWVAAYPRRCPRPRSRTQVANLPRTHRPKLRTVLGFYASPACESGHNRCNLLPRLGFEHGRLHGCPAKKF